jgi:hypothetical protein
MLIVYMLLIICHFFLSGMLTSAIIISIKDGMKVNWKLWAFAPITFLFGLYHLIALIGAGADACSKIIN